MKKTILTIIAILSLGVASANTPERTVNTSLGPVLYSTYDITGLKTQKVGCNNFTNMCYTESEIKRVFYTDIQKIERDYIIATKEVPVWEHLANLLK